MEIKVSWTFDGHDSVMVFEDTAAGRAEANEIWLTLRKIEGVTNLYPHPQSQKKRNVVRVVFNLGGKPYTYLCKSKVGVGEKVVVYTFDGPQLVTVIESGELTDSELEKICPLAQFKYLAGKVVPA